MSFDDVKDNADETLGKGTRATDRAMSVALVRKARDRAMKAIRELKRIDKRIGDLGCINAHIHYKSRTGPDGNRTKTNQMYLLKKQDSETGKRPYTYIGVDEKKQRDAAEKIARFKLREQLRRQIAKLKHQLRTADRQLDSALDAYRELAAKATQSVREYRAQLTTR